MHEETEGKLLLASRDAVAREERQDVTKQDELGGTRVKVDRPRAVSKRFDPTPPVMFQTTELVMKAEPIVLSSPRADDVRCTGRPKSGDIGGPWRPRFATATVALRLGHLRRLGDELPGLFRMYGGRELRLAAEAEVVTMTPMEEAIDRLMRERPDEVCPDLGVELLAEGWGFKIDTGPTGCAVGRPRKATGPDEIASQLRVLLREVPFESVRGLAFGKGGGRRTGVEQDSYELLSLAVAAVLEAGDVSVRALAKALSVSQGTAHRLEQHARHELEVLLNELVRNPSL
jgi:hypothetical protein